MVLIFIIVVESANGVAKKIEVSVSIPASRRHVHTCAEPDWIPSCSFQIAEADAGSHAAPSIVSIAGYRPRTLSASCAKRRYIERALRVVGLGMEGALALIPSPTNFLRELAPKTR